MINQHKLFLMKFLDMSMRNFISSSGRKFLNVREFCSPINNHRLFKPIIVDNETISRFNQTNAEYLVRRVAQQFKEDESILFFDLLKSKIDNFYYLDNIDNFYNLVMSHIYKYDKIEKNIMSINGFNLLLNKENHSGNFMVETNRKILETGLFGYFMNIPIIVDKYLANGDFINDKMIFCSELSGNINIAEPLHIIQHTLREKDDKIHFSIKEVINFDVNVEHGALIFLNKENYECNISKSI